MMPHNDKLRLLCLYLGFTFICIQFTLAQSTDKSITLKIKNASLSEILKQITKVSGIRFFFQNDQIDIYKGVSIDVKNKSINSILHELLDARDLSFNQIDAITYAIRKRTDAPNFNFSGTVTDSAGYPLPGATVTIKGTNKGAITNADGTFSLINNQPSTNVVISFTGFMTTEASIIADKFQKIILSPSESKLDETVIIAYGTTTARFNTGSVSKIKGDVIRQQPVSNVMTALQGRMPGVIITQGTGLAGGRVDVNIRGLASLRPDGSYPLYIVDGVPFTSSPIASGNIGVSILDAPSPLNNLNPADIESIEVLKDADATAIYGSRGSNGVILITTRKGNVDKTTVDANLYTGFSRVTRTTKYMNTAQYRTMRKEALANDELIPDADNAYDLLDWDSTKNIDWNKKLIGGTAHTSDAQLSLSGGNHNTHFRASGGYHRETTVFPGDYHSQRLSGNLSVDHLSENERFRSSFQVNYVSAVNNLLPTDLTLYVSAPPNAPDFKDANDNLIFYPSLVNPYVDTKRSYQLKSGNFITSALLSYELAPSLYAKVNLGYNRLESDEIQTIPSYSISPYSESVPSSLFGTTSIHTWIAEPQLTYAISSFRFLAGSTFQQSIQQGDVLAANGFSNDALLENIAAAASVTPQTATYYKYKYMGVFARISYDYKKKVLVNLNARRDGSSRFGPGRQFANFASIGTAWIFTESLHLPYLSYGKLRASYGTTGNDQIGNYGFMELWGPSPYPYQGSATLQPTRIANKNFSWEKNNKLEFGLELSFPNDRIFFSGAWFRNISNNQLVGYNLPPSVGFAFVQGNLPAKVLNRGWEFQLNTINVSQKNFTWSSSFNISIPKNKLLAYPNIISSEHAYYYEVGQSLYIKKALHYKGIDTKTGNLDFEDVDENGSITIPEDNKTVADLAPKYYGGLVNNLRYKNVQLDFLLQFTKQNGLTTPYILMPGYIGINQPTGMLDRWQQPGDQTNVPKYSSSIFNYFDYYSKGSLSNYFIGDASFIRLKNISLSWHINKFKKAGINSCRLYVQGQNLLTFTRYKGADPEVQFVNYLPPLKTLVFGIQASF
jgi:TonB-linked SusC/RagA family outer membrane protein